MAGHFTKILLSGPPGCGKTTIIRKVWEKIDYPIKGFYTEEVRDTHGKRIGFDVIMTDGRRGPLARVDISGPRVGKYGVNLQFLEAAVLPEIKAQAGTLILVDEIGKMECLSPIFTKTVGALLESSSTMLGTVALGGTPFIRKVRKHPEVELVEVTVHNRDELVEVIIKKVERGKKEG